MGFWQDFNGICDGNPIEMEFAKAEFSIAMFDYME